MVSSRPGSLVGEEVTIPKSALAYSSLIDKCVGSFKSPDRMLRLDQWLNVPLHGQCGERRSHKDQPSTRLGIERGTFCLAVRDLTNCANLAHNSCRHILMTVINNPGDLDMLQSCTSQCLHNTGSSLARKQLRTG